MYSNFKNIESVSKQARKPMKKAALSKRSSTSQTQPNRQSLRPRFVILRLCKKKGLVRSDHCKNNDVILRRVTVPHDTLENCLVPVYPDPVCAEAGYPKAEESRAMDSSSAPEAEGGGVHPSAPTTDPRSTTRTQRGSKAADGSARFVVCTLNQTLSALDNNILAYPEHVPCNECQY